MGSSDELSHSI